jgi:hypothetical protein
MAMFVENYADAEGVLIMAEMPGNHPDNGVIVRVINSNNNSLVSMIFPHGSSVPNRVAITLAGNGYEEGMEITGDFTFYNYETGEFSVTFDSEGETETLSNLFVNRDILDAHEDFTGLTRTQNVRLRSIFTTMAIWDSLAYELEGEEDEISARIIRRVLRGIRQAFTAVAAVATFVAIVAAPIFPAISVVALVVAETAAWVLSMMEPTTFYIQAIRNGENHCSEQAENPDRRPAISIIEVGQVDYPPNNGPERRLAHNESVTFEIRITDPGIFNAAGIINPEPSYLQYQFLNWFDPVEGGLLRFHNIHNAYRFSFDTSPLNGALRLTITRGGEPTSHRLDGRVRFVIRFATDVIINGVSDEGYTWEGVKQRYQLQPLFVLGSHITDTRGYLFLVNFSSLLPVVQGDVP